MVPSFVGRNPVHRRKGARWQKEVNRGAGRPHASVGKVYLQRRAEGLGVKTTLRMRLQAQRSDQGVASHSFAANIPDCMIHRTSLSTSATSAQGKCHDAAGAGSI
jgi:hypothetical protein